MMRRAMDGGRVIDANSDWTRVTNKRKERRNSARKQSGGSVSTVAGPSKPNLPPKPQSSVVKRRWTKMQPPSIPKSTSILRHQNVLLLNQWSGRIRNLAQSSSREIIQFLCSYWKTSQNLMQVGRFHSETASVVEAMAVLSECDQFPDVEFVILRVLLHVHWKDLPASCQGVSYFSALCRIFSSFLERGSPEAAMWIHGRRWVLTAIGEAFKYLVDKGKEAESVLGKLQKIDEEFSLRKRLLDEDSKTPTINKARECPEDFKVSSARCKKFEPTSIKTRGFADSNNNIAATHVRHGNTDVTAWQTVGRKKGVVSNRQQSYDFQMELCAPPLARTPRANKQSHATASAPGWSKVAGAHKELLTRLGRNWSPVDLPSYLKDTMELIPRLRGTNIKLDSFVSDVCKTPLVDNLRDFLVIQEEAGIASTTFRHISSFCAAVLKACPNIFYEHFEGIVDSALQAADTFSQDIHIQHAKKQILELHGMFVHTTYVSDVPQESFRDMFVVPTQEDFQTRKVYLRPNVVSGPFVSEEHYLDVHFRLLREDFLKPLRDGLAEVRGRIKVFDRSEENRFNAMRIYKNVTFEKNKERWLPGSLIMYFDPNRSLNIDWRVSKRFMLGALLVISNDNFTTLHLARVTRRDWECLSAGWLVIEPLWSEVSAKKLCLGSFVVGESMVFFEPYLHVLNALQNINPDEFPLARYIVHADPTEELPDYLQVESNRKYCIPLLGGEVVQRDIVNGEWPTAAAMGLNESQHEALTRALTQKVMLVQGPPGTGKTFLGLRIVSTLLTNPQAWRGSDDSACPILIVCLTNHALDQFLFGLLATTKKIVRLGGRCKDERLTEYMLKRNENELSPDLKRRMWERRQQLQQAEYELDCIQRARRELDNNIGIVSWESFQTYQVVTDVSNVPDGFSIVRWLEKGIQHSALSDDDIQFIRQNPKWGSEIFSFEDTFSQMESAIEELQQFIGEGRLEYKSTLEYYIAKLEYLKQVVSNGLPPGFAAQAGNVLDLDADQRSELYLFWVSQLKQALGTAERCAAKYISDCKARMKQVKMLKDKELIASNLVVGMTTTKAAQIQPLLQELKPRIVVVEEAAEVLESHIIAALTPAVQHLILLGDHKQLRPSPSDHEVGKDFKLEVSLFERLSNNNMPCKALNVQHRMQPNIAKLIEFIYPGLENHGSVLRYPAVRGLKNSVFFVDHQEPDRYMDELISHCNPHEARFIAALVTYLLLQGYDEKQITILSAYAGQLMYFRGLESDFPDLRKVRVCNIDNFQGEESDIILLSLVRSNPQNNIGFLKTENRVCVALSRAKHGADCEE
ncbi:NFX1-type zinc finger-containing protein 1-like [Thrips palmi]|uniref:NFX1-type zinc finger-containing protein 1-like n=1 Tax=Thrips palmi TaxID=161013 RepID=A0A6P8Z4P4_THRPL|nr:NFX1-type zinc finger-containing protein 1-like [Thrips palmi]